MPILKLIPGQKINLTVRSVERVEGNFGPQLMFTGETPDDSNATLYLNIGPAERQLDRIGLSAETVIGQTVEIARTEKNGTKYTDINRVNGSPPVQHTPKAAQVKQAYTSGPPIRGLDEDGPAALPSRLDSLFSLYSVCLDHVLAVEVPKLERAKIGASPEAVGSMTATLLIQAAKL